MKKRADKKNKIKKPLYGPSDDCNCPVCIFSKSHAPGDSYPLEKCPKWKAGLKESIRNKK